MTHASTPEQARAYRRNAHHRLFIRILKHYGGKCACCGFDDLERKIHGRSFLELDHINGGGNIHVKTFSDKRAFYRWIVTNFPEGFRVLCRGCNGAMEPGKDRCILHAK